MTFSLLAISSDIIYQILMAVIIILGIVITVGVMYPVLTSARGSRSSLGERRVEDEEPLLKRLRQTGEEGKYMIGLIQSYQTIRDGLLKEFNINYSRADTEREILNSIINRDEMSKSVRTRLLSLYVIYEHSRFGNLQASPREYEMSMMLLEDLLGKYPMLLKQEMH
ncbi:hypothetical protein CL673_06700 [Candidatus Bathyarchaeota archaeon]|jgi:hypothetical protein|nr:hypothetical protein [Candidatus Bathyarchaeota archaeon]